MTKIKNPKFQIFMSDNGQFYFRLVARNGRIILASEGYVSRSGCINGIESVKKNALSNKNFYRKISKDGRCYFILKAKNHRTIGTSQMYTTKRACEKGVSAVKRVALSALLDDTTR